MRRDMNSAAWLKCILSVVPAMIVLVGIELRHTTGLLIPVPYVCLMASVLFAGYLGGRLGGLIAGMMAAANVLHVYWVGIGPVTLIGSPINAAVAMALYTLSGYLTGLALKRHDQRMTGALEEQRREHEEPLNIASQITGLGYYIWNVPKDEPIVVSEQHARNHGVSLETYLRKAPRLDGSYELIHPDDRDKVRDWYKKVQRGNQVEMVYRLAGPGGERWLRCIVHPIRNEAGEIEREICASRDITELKATEKLLSEAQKLESVGRLSAGISHDFNNILTVVTGNIELALLECKEPDAQNLLNAALEAAFRGATLTRQLLAIGRKSELNPERLDINEAIGDMHDLFRRTLPSSIRIERVFADDLCNIKVDRTQFESALLNLAINARDAMPEGGTLTLQTELISTDESYDPGRLLDMGAGRHVQLTVSDEGTGMSEEVRARVWEPFYTTKPEDQGSGLGLPMVYGFVMQSGGHVQLHSSPDEGTSVQIFFPECPEEANEEPGEETNKSTKHVASDLVGGAAGPKFTRAPKARSRERARRMA
ncbi:ATP-binding protein [Marinovum sp. KMM 9879]